MAQQVDTLIECKYLIPIIPRNTVLNHQSVVIHKQRIVDILDSKEANKRYSATRHFALNDHALMPGLINAHTHVPLNLFRGLADDLPLMDWLQNHMWKAEAAMMCPEAVALGTELAVAEMLQSGITCFYDMFFFSETIMQTVKPLGIRAKISLHIMDVANQWAKDADECFEKSLALLDQPNDHPLLDYCLSLHAPYTVSDASFKRAREIANKHQLPIIVHLHETQKEIDDSVAQYGKRPIKRLYDLGFLGNDVLAVHMVHLNDEDLNIISETKLNVVHCPESNLKLASGFAPIQALLDRDIVVAIGTDSVASNNDLDMIGEMRQAAFLQKALTQDPTTLPAYRVLEMATIDGARAMKLDHEIGSIEIGKAADLCAIDLSDPFTQPCYNPMSQIIYAANRKQVSHVWVNGDIKVEQHQLLGIDPHALLQQAQPYIDLAAQFQYPPLKQSTEV